MWDDGLGRLARVGGRRRDPKSGVLPLGRFGSFCRNSYLNFVDFGQTSIDLFIYGDVHTDTVAMPMEAERGPGLPPRGLEKRKLGHLWGTDNEAYE